MRVQGQRDLLLLSELERNAATSQRSLSLKLGVALGLTNLYIKRLARKGYIKVTTIPRNRIRYLLTPQGLAEKSRLTYQYMQYSITHYRDMRTRLRGALTVAMEEGVTRVVIYGTGELAEMAYLSLQELNLTLVGFIDDRRQDRFLSYPVSAPNLVGGWEFDAVLLTDLENGEKHREVLERYLVPERKILTLSLVA
jgi:DNA-binding MarR family transcriptional regulator